MNKTILMIHGMWCSGWIGEKSQAYFEGRGDRCIVPTLRFHGVEAAGQPAKSVLRRGIMMKLVSTILIAFCLVLASCAPTKPGPVAAAQISEKEFDDILQQGSNHLRRGEYLEAREHFDMAISLNPKSERAHNLRGIAFLNLNNFRDAEKDFLEAIRLSPAYSEACNNLGALYFLQQKLVKAEEMLRRALSLNPDSASSNYSLGTLLMLQGRREEGTRYLAYGIELDPDYLGTHKVFTAGVPFAGSYVSELYLAFARLFASKGDVEKTLEFLNKAKAAGFRDWSRIAEEKEFETVLADPRIKEFLQKHQVHSADRSL